MNSVIESHYASTLLYSLECVKAIGRLDLAAVILVDRWKNDGTGIVNEHRAYERDIESSRRRCGAGAIFLCGVLLLLSIGAIRTPYGYDGGTARDDSASVHGAPAADAGLDAVERGASYTIHSSDAKYFFDSDVVAVTGSCGVILICFGIGIFASRHLALEQLVQERTADLMRAYNENLKYQKQLRSIAKELCASEERIQRRIGQDLHDGLGQNLTGIGMLVQSLHRRLAEHSLPEVEDTGEIVRLLSEAVKGVRDIAKVLCPVSLERRGLRVALEELAVEIQHRHNIDCILQFDRGVSTGRIDVAVNLYRIAQEALTNAVKHSRATSITLSLKQDAEGGVLSVRDNGIGLPANAEESGGMGLRIMQCRAEMINSPLTVTRLRQGGTLVSCRFDTSARHEESARYSTVS